MLAGETGEGVLFGGVAGDAVSTAFVVAAGVASAETCTFCCGGAADGVVGAASAVAAASNFVDLGGTGIERDSFAPAAFTDAGAVPAVASGSVAPPAVVNGDTSDDTANGSATTCVGNSAAATGATSVGITVVTGCASSLDGAATERTPEACALPVVFSVSG